MCIECVNMFNMAIGIIISMGAFFAALIHKVLHK